MIFHFRYQNLVSCRVPVPIPISGAKILINVNNLEIIIVLCCYLHLEESDLLKRCFTTALSCGARDLARIFITGCPNWDFKNLGCPKSPFEKLKIITLIMYIHK